MSFRRAARKDANHQEIVEAFRARGYSVLDIAQLKNCADLVVSKDKETWVIEIKDGSKPPSARMLTEGEAKFAESWNGLFAVVFSTDDIDHLPR